jgi:REP element-mobilizing transposase RayT
VPGGLYHVILRSSDRRLVLRSVADIKLLEECLEWALLHSGAQMYAYSWLPSSIHLLLKMSECQLEWSGDCLELVVKRICGRYTQSRNRRLGKTGALFRREYSAKLVDAEGYLLNVTRYVHRSPVAANLCGEPERYAWTSHRAYLGKGRINSLTIAAVLAQLESRGSDPWRAYGSLMKKVESSRVTTMIEHGSEYDRRIIGDRIFVQRMGDGVAEFRPSISREQLIEAVGAEFGVTREQIFSTTDRQMVVVEARALIAWQAVRNGMRPGAIVLWLGNTWPNFLTTIKRHRPDQLGLFDLPIEELVNGDPNVRSPRSIHAASG